VDTDSFAANWMRGVVGHDQGYMARLGDHRVVAVSAALPDPGFGVGVNVGDHSLATSSTDVPQLAVVPAVEMYAPLKTVWIEIVEVNDIANGARVAVTTRK
jgi:hypothetical protein